MQGQPCSEGEQYLIVKSTQDDVEAGPWALASPGGPPLFSSVSVLSYVKWEDWI